METVIKRVLWSLSLLSAALTVAAEADVLPAPPIVHFHVVTEGAIYRGARPETEGWVALAKLGVKTDLNLDDDRDVAGQESQLAQSLGMRFESYPMSSFWKPHDDVVNAALAVLADPSYYPIYVHCQHGQDRTGVVVGLHRIQVDHWSPSQAYQEMLDIGFHPALFLLKQYFDEHSGQGDELL